MIHCFTHAWVAWAQVPARYVMFCSMFHTDGVCLLTICFAAALSQSTMHSTATIMTAPVCSNPKRVRSARLLSPRRKPRARPAPSSRGSCEPLLRCVCVQLLCMPCMKTVRPLTSALSENSSQPDLRSVLEWQLPPRVIGHRPAIFCPASRCIPLWSMRAGAAGVCVPQSDKARAAAAH